LVGYFGVGKVYAPAGARFFPRKADSEIPQRKELAPGLDLLVGVVSRSYGVEEKDLSYSRRGHGNEARNVATYLTRRLRGDRLKEIGAAFKINRYRTVSTIVERMKVRIERDEKLRKKVDHLMSTIQMSQEQT
jgi:chromosomal replication initiation ATPase DnaA